MFWDREPILECELSQKGYIYSRYIDDITISFDKRMDKEELQEITTKIYGMFSNAGLKPNRGKRKVHANNKRLAVHNLNLNSGKPTIQKSERAKIRAAVKELEKLTQSAPKWDDIKNKYEQANGRINSMKRLHPRQAQKYIEAFQIIKKRVKSQADE